MRTNANFNHKNYEINFESFLAAKGVKRNLGIIIKTAPMVSVAV